MRPLLVRVVCTHAIRRLAVKGSRWEGWASALWGSQLKLAMPEPHPTPWIQTV